MIKNRQILRLVALVGVLLISAGCFNRHVDPKADTNWQDDIVMAKDCGMDGLRCCVDQDPACYYGMTCCSDPNNSGVNMCAESCECGQEDTFCCANNTCDNGLVCVNGKCRVCGHEGEYCCAGAEKCITKNNAKNDLVCYKNQCVRCGLPNNPCCGKTLSCVGKNAPDKTRAECRNNICRLCGANGEDACRDGNPCNDKHLLNNNKCLPCGDENQPCCQNEDKAGVCNKASMVCHLGFCVLQDSLP